MLSCENSNPLLHLPKAKEGADQGHETFNVVFGPFLVSLSEAGKNIYFFYFNVEED